MASKKRIAEKDLVRALVHYLVQNGAEKVYMEAQFCNRFVDILGVNKKNGTLVAIEAKVNSPKRAFCQALDYKYFADYVYVAVLKNRSNKAAIELAKKTGIGLIFVDKRGSLGENLKVDLYCHPEVSENKSVSMTKYILELNKNSRALM